MRDDGASFALKDDGEFRGTKGQGTEANSSKVAL